MIFLDIWSFKEKLNINECIHLYKGSSHVTLSARTGQTPEWSWAVQRRDPAGRTAYPRLTTAAAVFAAREYW